MEEYFGIEIGKLVKFNSAHFVVYENFREPLHGHSYKVSLEIKAKKLSSSCYVIDFDIAKTIMNEICDGFKDHLLLPEFNKFIKLDVNETDKTVKVTCEDSNFTFPLQDVKIIKTEQISAECLSKFIAHSFYEKLKEKHEETIKEIQIKKITVKVFEDKGKSGNYFMKFKDA